VRKICVAAKRRCLVNRRSVFFFAGGAADGGRDLRDILGGKGANLAEMARLGLRVPPGFTISADVCTEFARTGGIPAAVKNEVAAAVARLEKLSGRTFGKGPKPLLLSVRSGARVSMPGMMDTVLDLGLDDETVAALADEHHDGRFAYDCYRRLCAMYGGVVLGLGDEPFEAIVKERQRARAATSDAELGQDDLVRIVRESRRLIAARTGSELPMDAREQLDRSIEAVFRSWNNPRAQVYRKAHGIPEDWGTAVTVQMMVFGNVGQQSATGVAFSRDPSTGAPGLTGEYLAGAQGEDVVAGVRTPLGIGQLSAWNQGLHAELLEGCKRLERHFADAQDVEFTIERGVLYFLQCRSAKRTAAAAVRVAVELVQEGLIDEREALLRVQPGSIDQLHRPRFEPKALDAARKRGDLLGTGLPAGPGAVSGRLAFTPAAAEKMAAVGDTVVLARPQTSPEDIRGMIAASALITSTGGMSSHAALVSRQMGKVAVVGCGAMRFQDGTATFGDRALHEGDVVSVDGEKGEVFAGRISSVKASGLGGHLEILLGWADATRTLRVQANADDGPQAREARRLGAQGIGLCRTEHMFFGPGKIEPMREMILARSAEERAAALAKVLPLQRKDFVEIFREMEGLPVTIRLLDPPLHEFLPHGELDKLARDLRLSVDEVRRRARDLEEANPMLGLRGCRLGILFPEITRMQSRAIFEAACEVAHRGLKVLPQVMVPLVGEAREFEQQERVVRETAAAVFSERGFEVPYKVGTMIEVPRAALTAGRIARTAEFFSFGTNDLTQMTLGLSRDDVGPVLRAYLDAGIYERDPFVTIDQEGVGELMRLAVERGRGARPDLKISVCGEHGGEAASIEFCQRIGLDSVSCSPNRLPVARLAAAQSALRAKAES
jgi:pyruvate,orthophosphate dikinase